jgi:ABC-type transport system involved in multi-copper enzyme maturation permease subunit
MTVHAFSRLLKTDLRNRRNTILITLGALVLAHAALALLIMQQNFDKAQLSFVSTLNIAVYFSAMLLPFVYCFSAWREERRQRSIYLLLSLPIPRTHLLMSKSLAVGWEILLISAVMAAGLTIQNGISDGLLFRTEPLITLNAAKIWFMLRILLAAACLVFLCFFSTLLGACFGKLSLLITCLVFAVGLVVTIVAMANIQPFFVFAFFGLGYFGGSVYLLEKKVGVG